MTEAVDKVRARGTAAVTMVYNEPRFLPFWRRHYGKAFGEAACYVIDHGSDDGSTDALGAMNRVRIPRSPMHDKKRSRFISEFCTSLLEWYDAVIYTDVDEFLVADPERYESLAEFCVKLTGPSVNCLGFNVYEIPGTDSPLEAGTPVLRQRRWSRFSLAMCKPLLIRSPVAWVPGFHSSNQPMEFGDVILFHLHYVDRDIALERQAKTRNMPWGDGPQDHYQRWNDDKLIQIFAGVAGLERITDCSFRRDDKYLEPVLNAASEFWHKDEINRHLFYFGDRIKVPDRLFEIPERFLDSLPNMGVPVAQDLPATAIGQPPPAQAATSSDLKTDNQWNRLISPKAEVHNGGRIFYFSISNPTDHIERFHLKGQFYESEVLARLEKVVPGQSVILDIGANVGNHTIYFAGMMNAARVIPFEPNPLLNDALRRNVGINSLTNVDLTLSRFALGRAEAQARLVVTDQNNWGNGHVALPVDKGGPANVKYEAVVEIRPLDSFSFERLDFIKIDVEGQEVEVLKGGLKTIARLRPVIFVEVGSDRAGALLKILKDLDYCVIDFFSSYRGVYNYLLVPGG